MREYSIALPDLTMHLRRTGDGPLLVLLHGWPQTSYCWRHVMPALGEHFDVVAPDLRGYGLTDKPRGDYTKRRMAQDIRELIAALGHDSAGIVGHDRGARVAHRFALDHPGATRALTLLDIAPTLHMMRNATPGVAAGYWHWLFHMRADLPERLAGQDVEGYLRYFFDDWTFQRAALEDGIPHYVSAFEQPGALRAGFDDYRATAQDIALDQQDQDADHVIEGPVQILWGESGLSSTTDGLRPWGTFAPQAFGEGLPECGHFIAEEQPEVLVRHLLAHHRR